MLTHRSNSLIKKYELHFRISLSELLIAKQIFFSRISNHVPITSRSFRSSFSIFFFSSPLAIFNCVRCSWRLTYTHTQTGASRKTRSLSLLVHFFIFLSSQFSLLLAAACVSYRARLSVCAYINVAYFSLKTLLDI